MEHMDITKVRMFSKRQSPASETTQKSFSTTAPKPAVTTPPATPQNDDRLELVLKQFSEKLDTVNKNVSSALNRIGKLEIETQKRFAQDGGASVPGAEPEIGTQAGVGDPPPDSSPITAPEPVEYTEVPAPEVVAAYSQKSEGTQQSVPTGTPRFGRLDSSVLMGTK